MSCLLLLAGCSPGLASGKLEESIDHRSQVVPEIFNRIHTETGKKYTGKLVSLNYVGAPLSEVLWKLAEFANLQIVSDANLGSDVSVRLNAVPWDQAFDNILRAIKLDYVREGNVIRVATLDQLRSEREELKMASAICDPLEAKELHYIKLSRARVNSVLPILTRYH